MLIELKAKTLNKNLLSYLRAHCLLFYNGKDIANLRVTEPTDLEYELMILDAYQKVLTLFKQENNGRFDLSGEGDMDVEASLPHRRQFIETYRREQNKIMANQFSLLATLKMILNGVKLVTNSTYTYQINQLCVGSNEHFMNCLHMRKYLRNLFAP